MQEPLPELRDGLSARGLLRLSTAISASAPVVSGLDLSTAELPPPLRLAATLGVLDITEYFSETSGGIRTYLLAKAAWVDRQTDVRQVLVVPGGEDSLVDSAGVRTYRLQGPSIPAFPQYRLLLSTRTTRKIFEHERPDLVEVGSHLLVPWVARIANRGLRAPLVWFYHGHLPRLIAPDRSRGILQRTLEALIWAYVRRLSHGCRAVLVASRQIAAELTAHGVERVVQVPLGVDLEHFHPRRRERRDATRARLGLPEGRLALFAGRYAREKGLDVVLNAWAEVERKTGTRLVLIGDGPLTEKLRAHPYAARVHWLPFEGERERFADLLAAADLYLAPGPYETFGLSALEAMACGTPVLTVDRGGVAERVGDSGAGASYPFGESSGLVASAERLCAGDLAALGRKGREFAERHHGWDHALEQLTAAYRRILAQ